MAYHKVTFLRFFKNNLISRGEKKSAVLVLFSGEFSATPLLIQRHKLVGRSEPTGGPSGPNFRVFRSTYSWEFRNEFLGILERAVGYGGNI